MKPRTAEKTVGERLDATVLHASPLTSPLLQFFYNSRNFHSLSSLAITSVLVLSQSTSLCFVVSELFGLLLLFLFRFLFRIFCVFLDAFEALFELLVLCLKLHNVDANECPQMFLEEPARIKDSRIYQKGNKMHLLMDADTVASSGRSGESYSAVSTGNVSVSLPIKTRSEIE